ncbi:flavin reductase family protein [Mycobacterium szulgai]|uniref:Flavin reductase n=1 Tax=Mycobacterium szulgai TaxID=1787 RepID=A0A1X2EJ28_MYCSZ|nr:flavin reductase family protein [Mycobacterium szulgai]MCV7077284.1 flavin reductase family protein [Mycobacterium szulgai]ORX03558.1 flavin reductase [Mycobacterium szulgai]
MPATDLLDEAALRRALGCFPSGVVAVCATHEGVPVGMAASSFTSVSLDPALVSVCIQSCSTTWPRLRSRPHLGVSVLAQHHGDACISLSRKEADRFAGVHWTELASGAVVIHGASASLDCRLYQEIPAGDHLIALLEIWALNADPDTAPLVFHGSRFRRLECR